jgi:ERF superfamily
MTDKVKNIYTALLASQQEFDVINKDAAGEAGAGRKYKYASLPNVLDAVLPALNGNGIALLQMPVEDGEVQAVKTILHHAESGTEITCTMSLNKDGHIKGMQAIGSAITYARRYSLMSLLGIAAEDDDGQAAVAGKTQEKPKPKPVAEEPLESRFKKATAFIAKVQTQDEFEKHKVNLLHLVKALGSSDMATRLNAAIIFKEQSFSGVDDGIA